MLSASVLQGHESWVVLEILLQLLESLKTLSIVKRGTLSQDVNSEVSLVDLLVVLLLLLWRQLVTFSLEVALNWLVKIITYECGLEVLLLLVQSSLNDLSSGQQSFLEVLQSLVLDVDGSLLVEHGLRVERQLLEDRSQEVILLLVLLSLLRGLLALVHSVTSLLVDRLLKDGLEELFRVELSSLL